MILVFQHPLKFAYPWNFEFNIFQTLHLYKNFSSKAIGKRRASARKIYLCEDRRQFAYGPGKRGNRIRAGFKPIPCGDFAVKFMDVF